jgi:metal-responsive CopG/Arc/MetJ family transcriptional regulator
MAKITEEGIEKPQHIKWLVDTGERINNTDGEEIEVWEFQHQNDDKILSEWATHFRNHYCSDNEIDSLIAGTRRSKKQYLEEIKFPDNSKVPGPSIRSGDFAEILIADYLEFICNYWTPRIRYNDKAIRHESTKGSDVIGFKIMPLEAFSPDDEMIVFEVKAAFTEANTNRLQDAINASTKDEIRISESLNALKQRFITKQEFENKEKVQRFQNIVDYPYKEKSGVAAVLENTVYTGTNFPVTNTTNHYNRNCLSLIVVKGEKMMPLVHELYRRAADEA